ncbi:hypothetical protein DRE_03264 [Drechslerella stenobrocha 248]|uniref:Alpha/beta hydrolase fold-3 domain-containing protein n=1 Tax=Drechslerella stenobrocha 248 TaxID=1043628 RepID=W7HVU3_9PEZI|nr:hypothetical protein DRE_03264 [Drechslerella stenobrocha 248]
MIDHVLGRPSNKYRKFEVFCVVVFWTTILGTGDKHGPPFFRKYFRALSNRLTPWQTIVSTMLCLYVSQNFSKIMGLESPEPLANLYTKAYFRATWVTTALDAGFWTAMPIRWKWLRDFCGPMFSIFYLFATRLADEKQRKCRATITTEHMRVSWNKMRNPYLVLAQKLVSPPLGITPRHIKIARPRESPNKEPVNAVLYFNGSRADLYKCSKIILDFPGGGFVAMSPRCHDDKLCAWARKLPCAIISVDYKKAPEYPYPYALNECYDVYHSIVYTNGKCVGLSGENKPRVVLVGDSAGGNFAVGVTLMILNTVGTNARYRQQEVRSLPVPDGLVLVYPSLDMNIGSWMSEEQMSLIRDRQTRKRNRSYIRRKSEYFEATSGIRGTATEDSDSENAGSTSDRNSANTIKPAQSPLRIAQAANDEAQSAITGAAAESTERKVVQTRLATTSRISYFNDRILTPEMMRAMVILYVGPDNRPDFTTDFLLSPVVAPVSLLEMFPKCYFLTGERDPLVDDTVIFAGRLRRAKLDLWKRRKEMGLERGPFDEKKHLEVSLIPGISHGFLQLCAIFPPAWAQIDKCAKWMSELLDDNRVVEGSDGKTSGIYDDELARRREQREDSMSNGSKSRTGSMSEDERPLEIGMASLVKKEKEKGMNKSNGVEKRSRAAAQSDVTIRNGGDAAELMQQFGGYRMDPAYGSNVVSPGRMITEDTRSKSQRSLASDEDLVSRRMEGLTNALGGAANET